MNSDTIQKSTPPFTSTTSDSEGIERFLKENKLLKEKVNQLEQENVKLKKSLFELAIQRTPNPNNAPITTNNLQFSSTLSLDQLFHASQNFNNAINNPSNTNNINNSNTNIDFKNFNLKSSTFSNNNQTNNKKFKLKQNIKAHTGAIYSVNYSTQSNIVATGGLDKTVKIWHQNDELSQYELLWNLKEQNSSISHVIFSKNSKYLCSTSLDYLVNVYDLEMGQPVSQSKLTQSGLPLFSTFHWEDSNRCFVSTSRGEILEKDLRSSNLISRFKRGSFKINSLMNRPGLDGILFGNELGNLEILDFRMNMSIELNLNNDFPSFSGPNSTLNGCNSFTNAPSDNLLITHLASPVNMPDSSLIAMNLTNHTNQIYDLNCSSGFESYETNDLNLNLIQTYSGYENSYANIRCSMLVDDTDCWFVTGSSDGIIYLNCNKIEAMPSPVLNSFGSNEIILQDQLNQNLTRIYDVQFNPNGSSNSNNGIEFSAVGCDGHLRIWNL